MNHKQNIFRQKAEALLREKSDQYDQKYSESDQLKLRHELEVHKIELDLQDEEMEKIAVEKERCEDEYNKLYDLHTQFILHMIKTGRLAQDSSLS